MSYYTGVDEDARLEQGDSYQPSPEEIAEHEADDGYYDAIGDETNV